MNSLWTITYGNYELAVDRRILTYRLTETTTNTVWADALSLGWMDIKDRATGEISRHSFGAMKIFSVSEKAGPQGKRILFGLDCEGVPVDIYLICSEREIQMVVESNRDSKTHTMEGFGLCPGLCSVPDGGSYLVIPNQDGAIVKPEDAPTEPLNLPIWSCYSGVTMPFVGGVRQTPPGTSLLTLITDSAYGSFTLKRQSDATAGLDTQYTRDPERRRLDLRVILQSEGNYITIARNYREKIISDRNHVTLRQKMKDRPDVTNLVNSIFHSISHWEDNDSLIALVRRLSKLHPPEQSLVVMPLSEKAGDSAEDHVRWRLQIEDMGFQLQLYLFTGELDGDRNNASPNVWESMGECLEETAKVQASGTFVVMDSIAEWGLFATSTGLYPSRSAPFSTLDLHGRVPCQSVPLLSTVYHDCLNWYHRVGSNSRSVVVVYPSHDVLRFLNALLVLASPHFLLDEPIDKAQADSQWSELERIVAILTPLHALCFSAFLVAHRFLTPDCQVEEAIYSDKTRIIINQSETETYESDDLILPPLGFYVRHRQMEAFDALRVGEQVYGARAWRIARSRDGKPLEQSEDILRQEFAISSG
jgi:hypothetical protein